MCKKNLDKSLEAVSSTNKCYEYPCLELEHLYKQPGCSILRFYLSPTRWACLDISCPPTSPDYYRGRSAAIATDLHVPFYEVIDYEH